MTMCKHCGQALPSTSGVKVDTVRAVITVGDTEVKVTPCEAQVMNVLIRHWRRTVTKESLHHELYGLNPNGGAHVQTLAVYISNLRRALKAAGTRIVIMTAWGKGWRAQHEDHAI